MSFTVSKVGRISRKRFVSSEETVLEVLHARLKGEKDVSIRRYLRQKIKLF
jgi:hypothetical protein